MRSDLLAHLCSVLNIWKNHLSVINVVGVNVGQTEIHITEPLVPEPGACDV